MKKCAKLLGISLVLMAILMGCSKQPETFVEKESTQGGLKIDTYVEPVQGFSIGEYKGLKVTVTSLPDVTDADVQNYIDSVVESALVVNENTSRAVETGDTVNVTYTGYMNGVEIEDSSIEDYNIRIGSGLFFNGAEVALVGAVAGDTVEIPVTFPNGYPRTELVGKNAVYKVTVNYIHEEGQGELTDAIVASISDCKTVDEFYQLVRQTLETSRANERVLAKENAVWAAVLEQVKEVQYDETALNALMDSYKAYDQEAAQDFEMSLEAYVSTYQGMDIEEYNQLIRTIAENELLEDMVVTYIARQQGIDGQNPTDEELNAASAKQGYESADAYAKTRLEEDKQKDIIQVRVMKYLMSVSEIIEK